MLPRLRRHRRRANERCDWPKAAIARRGVSTRSGPKRLICEILTLSEHDIAIGCDIANHLPCTGRNTWVFVDRYCRFTEGFTLVLLWLLETLGYSMGNRKHASDYAMKYAMPRYIQ